MVSAHPQHFHAAPYCFNGIALNMKSRKNTAAFLLNVEKAFDKAWYNVLIRKLVMLEVPIQFVIIIKSFLINWSFNVRVGDKEKKTLQSIASVLMFSKAPALPLTFSLYTLTTYPTTHVERPFSLQTIHLITLAVATKKIQRQINLGQPWLKDWKILINTS